MAMALDSKVFFSGTHELIIDDGGRIAIPSNMYNGLLKTAQPDTLYAETAKRVRKNGQVFQCVKLLPYEVLHYRASKLMVEFTSDDERDQFGEIYFSKYKALEIKLPQPRVTLPAEWLTQRKTKTAPKDKAFLGNNVTVTGAGEVIEIWNLDEWPVWHAEKDTEYARGSGHQAAEA